MRFLWVNNVAEPLGGTLQATHSMVMALAPGGAGQSAHRHHIVSLGGTFGMVAQEMFKSSGAKLSCATRDGLQGIVNSYRPEVVIYQNTVESQMVQTDPRSCVCVHYLHSMGGITGSVKLGAANTLCVSKVLAKQAGLPPSTVLYQPCWMPLKIGARSVDKMVIGKIATQRQEWWKVHHIRPFLDRLRKELKTSVAFEPITTFSDVLALANAPQEQLKPGVHVRAKYFEWDFMYAYGKIETFGRCIREAQMAGCVPIVMKNSAGPEEIVKQWGGIIAESPEDAAEQVIEAWETEYEVADSPVCTLPWWRIEFIQRLCRMNGVADRGSRA